MRNSLVAFVRLIALVGLAASPSYAQVSSASSTVDLTRTVPASSDPSSTQPLQSKSQTGLDLLPPDIYQRIPEAPTSYGGVLPPQASIDREPTAGFQGKQSSCTTFAVAFAAMTMYEDRRMKWGIDNPNHVFSPAYIYNQLHQDDPTCRSGTTFLAALNLVGEKGNVTLSRFMYDEKKCTQIPSALDLQEGLKYRVAQYRRVNLLSQAEVKSHIVSGTPIMIGINIDQAFYDLKPGQMYRQQYGMSRGPHAVVLDAYDDTKGAYRILNSWGADWVDKGHVWITYDVFQKIALEGYVFISFEDAYGIRYGSQDVESFPSTSLVTVKTMLRDVESVIPKSVSTANDFRFRPGQNLELYAAPGTSLTNARLECVKGACNSQMDIAKIASEPSGKSVNAIWLGSNNRASTWTLTANENHFKQLATIVQQVPLGADFTVVDDPLKAPSDISIDTPLDGTIRFAAGTVSGTKHLEVTLSQTETKGGKIYFHYRLSEKN